MKFKDIQTDDYGIMPWLKKKNRGKLRLRNYTRVNLENTKGLSSVGGDTIPDVEMVSEARLPKLAVRYVDARNTWNEMIKQKAPDSSKRKTIKKKVDSLLKDGNRLFHQQSHSKEDAKSLKAISIKIESFVSDYWNN